MSFLSILRKPLGAFLRRLSRRQFDRAQSLRASGDESGAVQCLLNAIAIDPDHARAHYELGRILAGRRSYEDAARHLERSMVLDQYIKGGWLELGNVHYWRGDRAKARASFRAALAAAPDSVPALANLGLLLKEAGQFDDALVHLRRAHELAPDVESPLRNLLLTLIDSGRAGEAVAVAEGALAGNPDRYEARLFLGIARSRLNDPARALAQYDSAIRLRPDAAEAHRNRGRALQDLGRVEEAIAAYARALELQSEYPIARLDLALARLLAGDYARGWEDYEARRASEDFPVRSGVFPEWDGSPLAGHRVLVYSEQGIGDEIMFASCLPALIAEACECVIECEPRLAGLFQRSFPGATVYPAARDRAMPDAIVARDLDFELPSGSLPRVYRRTRNDFPRHTGYLRPDAERVARWRKRLADSGGGLNVGISWIGGVEKTRRPVRSIALDRWLPILQVPGVSFVSLQYTPDAGSEVTAMRSMHGVRIEHWQDAIDDYEETAALTGALDLVISVCTALVHLGGAIGQRVWVVTPQSPEWRYGMGGNAMPWYPSVRLIRQDERGEWASVIAAVAADLQELAQRPGAASREPAAPAR